MAKGEYPWTDTAEQKAQCAAAMLTACWRSMSNGKSILENVSAPNQYHGYSPYNRVTPELEEMAKDVLTRYHAVLAGADPQAVGCVLPTDYLWFHGDGLTNYFRNGYSSSNIWRWEWANPYQEG